MSRESATLWSCGDKYIRITSCCKQDLFCPETATGNKCLLLINKKTDAAQYKTLLDLPSQDGVGSLHFPSLHVIFDAPMRS